jgi:hypothetical protein
MSGALGAVTASTSSAPCAAPRRSTRPSAGISRSDVHAAAQQEFERAFDAARNALEVVVQAAGHLAEEKSEDDASCDERVDHLNAVPSMLLLTPLPPWTIRMRCATDEGR